MLKPTVGFCASDTATPLTAAKTPVMVNTVVKSKPQVERRLRYFGATNGWSCLFSHFQHTAKKPRPITTPTITMNQLAAPALPASLTAKVIEQTLITSRTAPSQSTLMPLDRSEERRVGKESQSGAER